MFLEKDNCAASKKELILESQIQKKIPRSNSWDFLLVVLKLSNIIILNQINIQVNLVFQFFSWRDKV
jgi:hypothetical protein